MTISAAKEWICRLAVLMVGLAGAAAGWAQDLEGTEHDVLVYHNGDRLVGHFKQEAARVIIFVSDRFGELRVPSDKAVVIKGDRPEVAAVKNPAAAAKPAAPVAPASAPATPAAVPAAAPVAVVQAEPTPGASEEPGKWYSPAMLTAKLREYFNPWSGRFAFSSEAVNDTASRSSLSVELTLKRKWKADEVQLKGRYDFSQTSGRTTTDMFKAEGLWRHDYKKKGFALYRPSLEWNQASYRSGVPTDYVQLQQELGAGWTVYTSPKYKVRLGASENFFDVWSIVPGDAHLSRISESAFIETEFKIPWGMLLTERGVAYYSLRDGEAQGSENRIELTKRFSETLSTAIRHELRRGSPDGRTQSYARLKLLLGLDF